MKRFRLLTSAAALMGTLTLALSCGDKIVGTFYLSEEALKYEIDTTITSFRMVDNHGITEEFYLHSDSWGTSYKYFHEWGVDGNAFGETFYVKYLSVLNDFCMTYVLRADVDYSELEVEWGYKDFIRYNFKDKKVVFGTKAKVKFYDSLWVKDHTYGRIIEIDYTDVQDKISEDTPVKTFISGERGLIKFTLKSGVTFERIDY